MSALEVPAASSILSAAADRIRDLAAAAKPGPWTLYDRGVCWEIPELPEMHDGLSGFREVDARWIAALSPAVAAPLESLFRSLVTAARQGEAIPRESARIYPKGFHDALALARAVLGEDTHV